MPGASSQTDATGDQLCIDGTSILLTVVSDDPATGGRVVQFPSDCRDAATIESLLNQCGEVPLPPYIDRIDPGDAERYQTRYVIVRAPSLLPQQDCTFSDELLAGLQRKGVELARITLHVGLGTFRPVETEDLTQLELHSEWIEVSAAVVEAIRNCRGRVIAVGTTSVRATGRCSPAAWRCAQALCRFRESRHSAGLPICRQVCSPTFIFRRARFCSW